MILLNILQIVGKQNCLSAMTSQVTNIIIALVDCKNNLKCFIIHFSDILVFAF